MGYILPIQQYQYRDYQNRITEEKKNPQFIDKAFKVILEKQHEEIAHNYDRLNESGNQMVSPRRTDDKLFETLTGKGSKFSKSI